MNTKDKILVIIKKSNGISGADIGRQLNISRQSVNKYINRLIRDNLVIKVGNTKSTMYYIAGEKPKTIKISKIYKNRNLDEDEIFSDIELRINLKKYVTQNTYKIINYAFTEIFNNAIDHSKSEKIKVDIIIYNNHFEFTIRDYGIGLFYSIYKNLKLQNENEAIIALIKGKTTTMSSRHSGEGIFFTSKLCDSLIIRSHLIELNYDNLRNDMFYNMIRYIKGTNVRFTIKRNTNRSMKRIFNKFSPKEYDYKFSRTKITLNLLKKEFISRSEAKRLLIGMEKFEEIIIDFKKVENVGQAFIDEVFRVFKNKYSSKRIIPINVNSVIEEMIRHIKEDNSIE